jgi:hypothetical protein
MANEETVIQQEIRLEAQKAFPGLRLFRNECGTAIIKDEGKKPRYVRYGLSVGSPDLVGWRTITITQGMVGRKFAQFVGCEVKTEEGAKRNGKHERQQKKWIELINRSGGLAFVAVSPAEAIQKLNPAQIGV